jgi:alpha-beta hydrolase superfamily lysophospholipase
VTRTRPEATARSRPPALSDAGVSTKLQLYPGGRHELLNETNRDEVTNDVIGWFDGLLAD